MQRNFVTEFHRENVSFTRKRIGFSGPPSGGLVVTYAIHL